MFKFFAATALVAALAVNCAASGPALKVGERAPAFHLTDQFNNMWSLDGRKDSVTVVVAANRQSGNAMGPWVDNLKSKYGKRIQVLGLIDLQGLPGIVRGFARAHIRSDTKDPVMVDFHGATSRAYEVSGKHPVVVVIGKKLVVKAIEKGNYTKKRFAQACAAIDEELK